MITKSGAREGARLRPRQAGPARARRDRLGGAHAELARGATALGVAPRHPRLHVARAGRGPPGGRALRRLLLRRRALRDAHRDSGPSTGRPRAVAARPSILQRHAAAAAAPAPGGGPAAREARRALPREGPAPRARPRPRRCCRTSRPASRASSAPVAADASCGGPRGRPVSLLVLAALGALGFWAWRRGAQERWARREALPEIQRLIDARRDRRRLPARARRRAPVLAGDPRVREALAGPHRCVPTVDHAPSPRAPRSSRSPTPSPTREWQRLGVYPDRGRGPAPSCSTASGSRSPALRRWSSRRRRRTILAAMHPSGSSREGGPARDGARARRPLPVRRRPRGGAPGVLARPLRGDESPVRGVRRRAAATAGPSCGSSRSSRRGKTLSFDEAMALFRDRTGRPGPSTWELGGFPEGHADFPVSGVSWYEAAAYAEFAGKSLPTLHHWFRAADLSGLLGPPALQQLRRSGAAAGWARDPSLSELRHLRHGRQRPRVGAGTRPATAATRSAARGATRPTSTRAPTPSIPWTAARSWACAAPSTRRRPRRRPSAASSSVVPRSTRRSARSTTTSSPSTGGYFDYDRGDLAAKVESVDDRSEHWRVEKVSFAAAYGGERIPAQLFLPRNATPAVPGRRLLPARQRARAAARSSALGTPRLRLPGAERAGRAVPGLPADLRAPPGRPPAGPTPSASSSSSATQDVRRAIDFLESRPDIDRGRLAFYGLCMGANYGADRGGGGEPAAARSSS